MFSIVIPMFNASETIIGTLMSCVEQTFLPKEIIIVDDCSNDDSFSVVKEWEENYMGKIKIIIEKLNENSGPSKARNRGWDLATGKYLAFLDADDRFFLEKLEIVYQALLDNNKIVLLGHEYAIGNIDTRSREGNVHKLKVKDFLKKNHFATSAVIVKREITERFDESMRYIEDQDLFLGVTQSYDKTYYLQKVLVLRERGMNTSGGLSGNLWAMRKGEIKMYYKFCKINNIVLLFPLFYAFSISKHGYKKIKDIFRKIK